LTTCKGKASNETGKKSNTCTCKPNAAKVHEKDKTTENKNEQQAPATKSESRPPASRNETGENGDERR